LQCRRASAPAQLPTRPAARAQGLSQEALVRVLHAQQAQQHAQREAMLRVQAQQQQHAPPNQAPPPGAPGGFLGAGSYGAGPGSYGGGAPGGHLAASLAQAHAHAQAQQQAALRAQQQQARPARHRARPARACRARPRLACTSRARPRCAGSRRGVLPQWGFGGRSLWALTPPRRPQALSVLVCMSPSSLQAPAVVSWLPACC